MSHFLRPQETAGGRTLGKPRAGVVVQLRKRRRLVIQPGIKVVAADARMALLPADVTVVDGDGKSVAAEPGALFLVTTETIDPFHLIVQVGP